MWRECHVKQHNWPCCSKSPQPRGLLSGRTNIGLGQANTWDVATPAWTKGGAEHAPSPRPATSRRQSAAPGGCGPDDRDMTPMRLSNIQTQLSERGVGMPWQPAIFATRLRPQASLPPHHYEYHGDEMHALAAVHSGTLSIVVCRFSRFFAPHCSCRLESRSATLLQSTTMEHLVKNFWPGSGPTAGSRCWT